MMLDSNDKKYIKEIVNETLKKISSSKYKGDSEFDSYYRNKLETRLKRINELAQLYENGEETLSELLELKKLLKEQKKDEETPRWKQKSKYVINKGVENIKESNIAKDSLKALAYTNPITALMYQNKDLFKGLGNIAKGGASFVGNSIYQLLKGKRDLKQNDTGTSLIPTEKQERLETRGSTNYIAAKEVYLQGGTNYLNVYLDKMPVSNQGRFNQKALPNNQLLLEDSKYEDYTQKSDVIWQQESARPKEVKEDKKPSKMLLGIKALEKSLEAGNKILSVMKTRQFLILGAILLGVAGIRLLAKYLSKKLNDDNIGANIGLDPKSGFKMINNRELSKMSKSDVLNNVENSLNSNYKISDYRETKGTFGKPDGGVSFSIRKNSPYFAPFDLKIIEIKNNTTFENDYDLRVIRQDKKSNMQSKITRSNYYWLKNVSQPLFAPSERIIPKGTIIGFVGESGNIIIKPDFGSFMNEADSYKSFINDLSDGTHEDKQAQFNNFKDNYSDSLYNNRTDMFKAMNKSKKGVGGTGYYVDSVNIEDLEKYQKDSKKKVNISDLKNIPTQISAPSRFYDSLSGKWINNYNVANKNVENAKSSETKTSTPKIQQVTQPTPQPIQKQNIDIPSPKSNIQVGFIDGLDAIVASSNNLTINTMTV